MLLAATVVASCGNGTQPAGKAQLMSQSATYPNPGKQQRFKEALKQANISYDTFTEGNAEYVRWKGEDNAKVEKIRASLFGPPEARQQIIAFEPPYQEQFKRYLKDNRIPFETKTVDGKEFVTWAEEDYPRVSKYQYFPRQTFERPK